MVTQRPMINQGLSITRTPLILVAMARSYTDDQYWSHIGQNINLKTPTLACSIQYLSPNAQLSLTLLPQQQQPAPC